MNDAKTWLDGFEALDLDATARVFARVLELAPNRAALVRRLDLAQHVAAIASAMLCTVLEELDPSTTVANDTMNREGSADA